MGNDLLGAPIEHLVLCHFIEDLKGLIRFDRDVLGNYFSDDIQFLLGQRDITALALFTNEVLMEDRQWNISIYKIK